MKSNLFEYRMEANLPEITMENYQMIADSLVLYHVIEKRTPELDDLARGMESVELVTFLKSNQSVCALLFPRAAEKVIDCQVLKQRIITEKKILKSDEEQAKSFLDKFIDTLQSRGSNAGKQRSSNKEYI